MGDFRVLLLGAFCCSATCFAQAADYDTAKASNFDYVEVDYVSQESGIPSGGSSDVKFEGFNVRGSYQFYEDFFAIVSYTDLSLDSNPLGIDSDTDGYSIGIGYVFLKNETGVFFGELTYNRAEASVTVGGVSTSADEDAVGVGAGFRLNTSDRTELRVGLQYIDTEFEDNLSGSAEFVYDFFENVSAVFAVTQVSDATGFVFGVRYSF